MLLMATRFDLSRCKEKYMELLEGAIERVHPEDTRAVASIGKVIAALESLNQKDEHHKAVIALEQLNNQLASLIGPAAAITSSDVASGPEEAGDSTEPQ